ncbi:MAG: pentapeptide repeat-containing protein [Bdellovibrionales bacterium]|nr:pentapeptide repeat-containing protein [Bdellovibrionales bacterium]
MWSFAQFTAAPLNERTELGTHEEETPQSRSNTVLKNTVLKNTVLKNTFLKNTDLNHTVFSNTVPTNLVSLSRDCGQQETLKKSVG